MDMYPHHCVRERIQEPGVRRKNSIQKPESSNRNLFSYLLLHFLLYSFFWLLAPGFWLPSSLLIFSSGYWILDTPLLAAG